MKLFFLFSLFTCLLLSGCATGSKSKGFIPRPYKEAKLPNGLNVLMVHDDSLPSVTFAMMFKTGGSSDPKGKAGLTSLTAHSIPEGTRSKSSIQYSEALGQFGTSLNVSVAQDYIYISVNSLSLNQHKVFDLFAEALLEPAFRGKDVLRKKKRMLSEAKKVSDRPDSFASLMFRDYLYQNHPYGVSVNGTVNSIKNIKQKDVIRHFIKYFRPNNASIAVVGRYTPDTLNRIEQKFGAWKKKIIKKPAKHDVSNVSGIQVRLVDKSDLVQSQIRFGHIGIRRNNPDFLKIKLANKILGSGFTSRLFDRIRQDLGLTYGINSYFDPMKETGAFHINTFTKNETLGKIVRETLKVLSEFQKKGVTSREVAAARAQLIGQFPEIVETAENWANNILILKFYGVGVDYLMNYERNLRQISVSDINKVIRKYFDAENMKILVFSNAKEVEKQLDGIGSIEVKSYKDY